MKRIIVLTLLIAALGYLVGPECYDGRGVIACWLGNPESSTGLHGQFPPSPSMRPWAMSKVHGLSGTVLIDPDNGYRVLPTTGNR